LGGKKKQQLQQKETYHDKLRNYEMLRVYSDNQIGEALTIDRQVAVYIKKNNGHGGTMKKGRVVSYWSCCLI
jgi:hypothetical protein